MSCAENVPKSAQVVPLLVSIQVLENTGAGAQISSEGYPLLRRLLSGLGEAKNLGDLANPIKEYSARSAYEGKQIQRKRMRTF
jgi:hypothetical protein